MIGNFQGDDDSDPSDGRARDKQTEGLDVGVAVVSDGSLEGGGTLAPSMEGEAGLGEKKGSPEKSSSKVFDGKDKVLYSQILAEEGSTSVLNHEFVVKDGVAELVIPAELMEDANPLWKCFVVGYFMNTAPHIGSVHATVNRIWSSVGKESRIHVQFIGKTIVLFRIEDASTRSRVLNRKFWHISEVPLMVGEWTPETARSPLDLSAMPLWVDLQNVPGYLYSKKGLSFLAHTMGKFIKLHPNTERCIRIDVARVLVEVDLTKPLPSKISFRGKDGSNVVALQENRTLTTTILVAMWS